MTLTQIAWLYVALWLLLVNGAWLVPLPLKINALAERIGLWAMATGLSLFIAWQLDAYTMNAPHQAWQRSEMYMLFVTLSVVFATPGMVCWWAFKRKNGRK